MGLYPTRKRNRIENYDYSQPCVVLITICTKDRRPLFGVVESRPDTPVTVLSGLGQLVETAISGIDVHYQNVTVETHSILPNHVHLLLRLDAANNPNPPSVSRIIKQFKEYVTKSWGENVWQKGFHDHIVRTEEDYLNAWNYVTYNPAKWESDENYVKQ